MDKREYWAKRAERRNKMSADERQLEALETIADQLEELVDAIRELRT